MDAANLIAELNGKFKSESISFGTWKDSSLPTAFISNQYCKGAVSPYGAHVLSYVPNGEKDLIMVSELSAYEPPKAIRGGVPVCWPWFGPAAKPMHGVARIQYWNMTAVRKESDGSDTVVFGLSIYEPHRLDAVFEVNFGAKLSMKLITVNQGTAPIPSAAHSTPTSPSGRSKRSRSPGSAAPPTATAQAVETFPAVSAKVTSVSPPKRTIFTHRMPRLRSSTPCSTGRFSWKRRLRSNGRMEPLGGKIQTHQ
ncbi:MAG: hypothetical protein V8T87_12845 [Victivallales bacterium]